jgi:hypothetical protein
MTLNLTDAKRRAAELGLEIRYPRRTGEVLFIDPVTLERVRQNNRRKDATRKVERLLRRSTGARLPTPSSARNGGGVDDPSDSKPSQSHNDFIRPAAHAMPPSTSEVNSQRIPVERDGL